MNIIPIKAHDVSVLLAAGIDTIRIYRDTSPTGTFSSPPIGSIALVQGQEDYEFVDETGLATHYYESTYYDTGRLLESPKSNPVLGGPLNGPLGMLNIDNVRELTDFPGVANLSDIKIGQLIYRAESLLQRFANRYGGWANSVPGFIQTQTTAALLLLEELYIRSTPSARTGAALGIMTEKIGSYSYSRRLKQQQSKDPVNPWDIRQYFSPEVIDALRTIVAVSPTAVTTKTTQVFPQLQPVIDIPTGFEIKPYWDGIDEELMWGTEPLHNWRSRLQRIVL